MPKILASTVINFNRVKPPFVYKIEPSSLYTNDEFKVLLYSPQQYDLFSPYYGITGDKQTETAIERIETLSIDSLNIEYPIAELLNVTVKNGIVNKSTRQAIYSGGQVITNLFEIVNSALKLVDADVNLIGSITVKYKSYPAQTWQHKGFKTSGDAMLFAQNLTTLEWENIPLSIGERTDTANTSIKIEAWTFQPKRGFSPYHAVIIYPADKQYKVTTDYGLVQYREKATHTIKAEELSFSGKEANTNYPIVSLVKVTGSFFDANLNEVTPRFRLSDGVIKSNIECYGFAIVEYTTEGLVYDYNADVTIQTVPTNLTTIRIGYIIAQEKGKIGIGASYKVPQWQNNTVERMDFYKITRKVVTQGNKTFEYPPNWDTDNSYPNAPSAPTEEKPEIGVDYLTTDIVAEAGHIDINGSIDYRTYPAFWYDPYTGSESNPDAVFSISSQIPSDISDTDLISKMNEAIDKAKERWGIV